jgi:hypothetical protein
MNNFPLKVIDSKSVSRTLTAASLPDTCPACHRGIEAAQRYGFIKDEDHPDIKTLNAEVIFQCPKRECQSLFVAYYVRPFSFHDLQGSLDTQHLFRLDGVAPWTPEKRSFPPTIEKLSPNFCSIFNQALEAERFKLPSVAGCGYRKALEFLVKDYLIQKIPGEAATIRKEYLGTLIQTRIEDANLKVCAQRATWLGNDETHYGRLWLDKDLKDLKALIDLTVSWLDHLLLTEEYLRGMPEGKK